MSDVEETLIEHASAIRRLDAAEAGRMTAESDSITVVVVATSVAFACSVIAAVESLPRSALNSGQIADPVVARSVAMAVLVALLSSVGIGGFLASMHAFFRSVSYLVEMVVVLIFGCLTIGPLVIASGLLASGHLTRVAVGLGLAGAVSVSGVSGLISRASRKRDSALALARGEGNVPG